MQTKAQQNAFILSEKKRPSKVAADKIFFPFAYVIGTTCFGECFLLHLITGTHHSS